MYIKKATHHFQNSIKSSTKIIFLSLDILSNSLYNASQTGASQSVFTEKSSHFQNLFTRSTGFCQTFD